MKKLIVMFLCLGSLLPCYAYEYLGTENIKLEYAKEQLLLIANNRGLELVKDSIEINDQRSFGPLPNLADLYSDYIASGTEDFQYIYFLVKKDGKYLRGRQFIFSTTEGSVYNEKNITKRSFVDQETGQEYTIHISSYGTKKSHESYQTFKLDLDEIH